MPEQFNLKNKPTPNPSEEGNINAIAPQDRNSPEYLAMRARIDAVKAEMRAIADDSNLTKFQKRAEMERLMKKLKKAQELRTAGGITEISAVFEGKEIKFELAEELEKCRELFNADRVNWASLPEEISAHTQYMVLGRNKL